MRSGEVRALRSSSIMALDGGVAELEALRRRADLQSRLIGSLSKPRLSKPRLQFVVVGFLQTEALERFRVSTVEGRVAGKRLLQLLQQPEPGRATERQAPELPRQNVLPRIDKRQAPELPKSRLEVAVPPAACSTTAAACSPP